MGCVRAGSRYIGVRLQQRATGRALQKQKMIGTMLGFFAESRQSARLYQRYPPRTCLTQWRPSLLRIRMLCSTFIAIAVCLTGTIASPQQPVTPAANVDALFRDSNGKLNKNKQVAYHIAKDLLQCNHWNEADRWLSERYIQHNPLVPSGRAGVVQFFANRPTSATCDKLDAPVVAVLADGDLVTVVTVASRKDSKGERYTTTWFDMWRIVDGKADEHWDAMVKP